MGNLSQMFACINKKYFQVKFINVKGTEDQVLLNATWFSPRASVNEEKVISAQPHS